MQELTHWAVLLEHVAKEQTCLGLHRRRQIFGIIGAVRLARGWHATEVAQVQPAVEEAMDESVDAFIGQQAVDLLLQFRIAGEFTRSRGGG